MIIADYKIRKMLEIITQNPSQVYRALGPSLVAQPGQQRCCHWGAKGRWPELCLCSLALGLLRWLRDQVFPCLGPIFGWLAGSLGSAPELGCVGVPTAAPAVTGKAAGVTRVPAAP